MSNFRQSLASKLGIGILLMTILIFVISLGVLFLQSRHMVRLGAIDRATSMLNTTVQRVCRHIKIIETATDTNDWLITEHLQPDSLLAISHRIVQLNRHVDGCSISTEPEVFPKFGRYFSAYTVRKEDSVETVIEEEYEYFEKVWYKTPHVTNATCWVVYYDESDSLALTLDGLIASYCKPLYNNDRQFVGVVSTDISLLRLSKIISEEKPYPNSYFMMIGDDGRFFIHPDTAKLFKENIFNDSTLVYLGHHMTRGKAGNLRVTINGKPSQVCYSPIPGTRWSLAIVCPDSDIMQGYYRLGYIVTPLIIVGLLFILLFSRWAVVRAIKPINQLLNHTRSISEGNYDIPIPHSRREDVVGCLQNSFARMQQSLNYHIASISYVSGQSARRNEELAKATRLMEDADRQKTIFIQNVTHQIRTPLNIVMGFSQILRDCLNELPIEEVKNIAQTMKHNTNSLNRMVLMLFDSSESGQSHEFNSSNYQLVSCNKVAQESIEFTKHLFPNLSVAFQSALPDTFCFRTNPLYLMRSIREILYNSAKYSDGQHLAVYVSETPTTIRYTIEDTGPGIPEAFRPLMFVPFTKVNDLSEGLGLGLPLARRHIVNLGGTITLDTTYHDGCRFIIEIPR